jgi:hypothetical protein
MIVNYNVKKCPRCNKTKSLALFGRNRTRADDRQDWCKDCNNRKRCLCGRQATVSVRIHYVCRWTGDVLGSTAGPPQYFCERHVAGLLAEHTVPGSRPITVTVAALS